MAVDKLIDSTIENACRTAEADAIRAKTGSTAQLTYDFDNGKGFADAIESIETGITPTGNVELAKQSGNDVTQYASASVRSASVSLNTPTVDANGLITASATVDTSGWIGSAPSSATKQLSTQAATAITPTESSQTAVESGKYTTGAVTVNPISSTYVGSGITRRSSSSLTASGATVSVPAGYYSTSASKSVSTTTHPNPTASINTSTGVVTASHTQSSGYVTGSTTTGTLSLTTQAAKTVTPSASSQTAVAAQRYTTGAVTVAAVPSETKTVDLNMANGNQVVNSSSGKWMTSVTVNKPATLLPENIKKDVNIGGVVGTMESGGGKPEQAKTLTLGASAPTTVTPDSGKVLSSVPVVLDTSVIKAENIKKDVQMLGVTGTHEGGGGGPLVVYGEVVEGSDGTQLRFNGSENYQNFVVVDVGNTMMFSTNLPASTMFCCFALSCINNEQRISCANGSGITYVYYDGVIIRSGDVVSINQDLFGTVFFLDSTRSVKIGVFW